MKYNDFIEILPNDIAQKLNSEYLKTKILNQPTSNNKNNENKLPTALINEKILEILLAYNIIINTLIKNNFPNTSIIKSLQSDYNRILKLFDINYSNINFVASSKTELIKHFFLCAKNITDISCLKSNCISLLKNILTGLEFFIY